MNGRISEESPFGKALLGKVIRHRHGDLWANAAALLLLAVQWFNPFAWRAIRAFRFDQEAACDARAEGWAEVTEDRMFMFR